MERMGMYLAPYVLVWQCSMRHHRRLATHARQRIHVAAEQQCLRSNLMLT